MKSRGFFIWLYKYFTSTPDVGIWHHYTLTWKSGDQKAYYDGTLIASSSLTGQLITNDLPIEIGSGVKRGYFFNGIIDEVAIYSQALTPEEIKAHYLAKRAGYPPTSDEPGSSFDNPITIYREGSVGDKLSEGESIYYKIWLNKERDITLTLDFGSITDIVHNPNLDIYLYNPHREQVSASTGENWDAFGVDEQIEYNTGSEEGYYYIKIVNLHSHPHYEPEELSLDVNAKSPLPPTVIEPTPVLLGTYSLELSAPGSNIIDGNIGEIKVFGSSNKHRIEIELDTPVVRLYNAENRYLGDYDIPLTFYGSDSVILLAFDEKVHMNLDGIAFYNSDGNQIEQGGGLLDALLMDIISIGLGKIIPIPIPTSTLGVLLESQDEMLVPDILSDDITHDIKSVVIVPKRGDVKKVVVFFSKGLDGTPVDNTLHLYVHVKGTGYPSGLSLGQYIPPIIVGTKYINDIPLVS